MSSSNTRIPKDQKSTLKLWPLLRMISGATYSGVPQKVQVFWPHRIFLAKPKSTWKGKVDRFIWKIVLLMSPKNSKSQLQRTSLMYPSPSSIRFSGLRSRYRTPFRWRYSKASVTQPTQNLAVGSSKLPLVLKKQNLGKQGPYQTPDLAVIEPAAAIPVSEQAPNFSSQAGLQQHVHIFVVFKRAI